MAGSASIFFRASRLLFQVLRPLMLLVAFWTVEPASTAPLPPIAPVDVCGTILSSKWLPPKTLPPSEGMSGSAGRQRNWPARFVVVLANVNRMTEQARARINSLLTTSSDGEGIALAPGELLLVVPSDNPSLLDQGRNMCITGFVVSGDEGGTWTRYKELSIGASECAPECK